MDFKIVTLYTDVVVWVSFLILVGYAFYVRRTVALREKWLRVANNAKAMTCAAVLTVFFSLTLLDSVHYRPALQAVAGGSKAYATQTVSLLDFGVGQRIAGRERSYSAPFALVEFDKTTQLVDNKPVRDFARLKGAGLGVEKDRHWESVAKDVIKGTGAGLICSAVFVLGLSLLLRRTPRQLFAKTCLARHFCMVWTVTAFIAGMLAVVWPLWHVLGTDTTGNDVLFVALKSVRTAVVIGTLATLSMLPFAVMLGMMAGFFKGWVDDVIQYIYTTLSSIPSVLLIAASVLMIQVYIDKNPTLYETGLERADLRLFLLAGIIGVTGWSGLARLLRAETMKVSAMDFVSAAKAFGASSFRILMRHVFPNVAHVVLIVAVLDFSGIVLYEAVLSYVGVGVDPVMQSFGSMINAASVEMSRSPLIWWNLLASFIFMVSLVLSANLFAAGVRDAFDPRNSGDSHA